MNKMFRDLSLSLVLALGAVVLLFLSIMVVMSASLPVSAEATLVETSTPSTEPAEVRFDVSALQEWCHGEDIGTIRMVDATPVKHSAGGYWTIADGYGEQWMVSGISLHHEDFLMLWIADNNTPDNVMDDVIVKVWVEAH